MSDVCRIGLIADTHGLLRPEALEALRGSDRLLHAGDVGDPAVLEALRRLAPLTAVRGNNDHGDWARALHATETLSIAGVGLYLLHDLADLPRRPAPAGTRVIVCGHSHRPLVRHDGNGLLIVNPGSAGPRRFRLPIAVGELRIDAGSVSARVIEL